jgi:hypothetical protein
MDPAHPERSVAETKDGVASRPAHRSSPQPLVPNIVEGNGRTRDESRLRQGYGGQAPDTSGQKEAPRTWWYEG